MSNGGVLGRRNVPGVDGVSGVWSLREIADAARKGVWLPYDLFDTDTTAKYTQVADAAGTWAVSGGELVATGGTQALFIRNAVSFKDGWVEADVNTASDGGLVLRFVDNSNYYLLVLLDDSGTVPSQNIIIFKRVGGAYTQLAQADISWARGTSKTIRFQAAGTALTAFVDGQQVASATDSAHAGPGGVGLRNNAGGGNVSKFQAFRWFF